MTAALIIFGLTYLVISGARLPMVQIDRPAAALCGAVAMVVFGVLTLEQAYGAIDLDILVLLFGLMVIAAYLTEAHFFRASAYWVLTRARSARSLLFGLVMVAGGLSAVLLNDTICLMMTPLVLAVVSEAKLPPLPYLLALATSANIGGVMTYTGNPQNVIIGGAAGEHLSYLEYLAAALPAGVVCLVLDAALLMWLFRRQLPVGPLVERSLERPVLDRKLTALSVAALLLFVVLAASGVSMAGAVAACAAVLIIAAGRPARPVLATVDWPLLVFFAGLLVVVAGLQATGAVDALAGALLPHLGEGTKTADLAFVGLVALAANVVSNVPLVLVAVDWVPAMAEPSWGYILLAFAATLAGNLTLFGSVANIIVFEGGGSRVRIGFFSFLRYGAVITLATLTVGLLVLWGTRAVL